MKNLFYILVIIPSIGFSQQKNKTLDYEKIHKTQNEIIRNLDNHQKQFKKGLLIDLLGTAISSSSTLYSQSNIPLYIGGSLNLIGFIGMIDSQKWFSRSNYSDSYSREILDVNDGGKITFKKLKLNFMTGDNINVKTLNGPVVMSGELTKITPQYIELKTENEKFTFYYNIIEKIFLK